jgi:hypothetical protein
MRLRYENTSDDCVAFSTFHLAHSPTHKRTVAIYTCVFGLAVGLAVFFLAKSFPMESVKSLPDETKNIYAAIQAVFVMTIYILLLPRIFRRSITKQTRKLYGEGRNKTFFCEHQLEIAEDGLIERTRYSELKAHWEAIERVERTETHTFLYVSAVSAHVIPHDRILEGDCDAFVAQVQKRIEQHWSKTQAQAHRRS